MNIEAKKNLQRVLGVVIDGDIGPITRGAFSDKLIAIASKDLGIFETSKNHGDGIAKFWTVCDYSEGYKDKQPYCAAAVSYWINQMGVFSPHDSPRTASAFGMEDWAKDIGISLVGHPKSIKRGDLIVYSFSHVGIATGDSDKGGNFATIEANTSPGTSGSQREGGGVYARKRNLDLVRSIVRI
jgi:hypothetical protein